MFTFSSLLLSTITDTNHECSVSCNLKSQGF